MTLSYEHDTWTTVTTSRGTYHWPSSSTPQKTELWLATIQSPPSPLNPDAFHSYLRTHPDPLWVKQLVRGLREGFTVGYTGPRVTYRAPQRPHTPLAAQKIRDEFYDEVDLGRMLGPFTAPPNTGNFHFWRTAPTFAIPKKYGTKLRRIEHLSFPRGASVNDFIDKLDFPVHFATVDETITRILTAPEGSLWSGWDIQDAYRNALLHPADVPLFSNEFEDNFYLQLRLGFGGSSFPGIFDQVGHGAEYAYETGTDIKSVSSIIDDFLGLHSVAAIDNKAQGDLECDQIRKVSSDLGLPLHPTKCWWLQTEFEFLGVGFDTVKRECYIPGDKRERYLASLEALLHDHNGRTTVPTLRRVLGQLCYVAAIIRVGRTRLFYLFACLTNAIQRAVNQLGPWARRLKRFRGILNTVFLSEHAIDDLTWWRALLTDLPRRRLLFKPLHMYDLSDLPLVTTDASDWGIGGWFCHNDLTYFFSIEFSDLGSLKHITYTELLALLVGAFLWDHLWHGTHVRWHTDCRAHVTGLWKLRTSAPELLPLHDMLDLRSARNGYCYAPEHLPGTENTLADDLSRNVNIEVISRKPGFRRCHPTTALMPSHFSCLLKLGSSRQ